MSQIAQTPQERALRGLLKTPLRKMLDFLRTLVNVDIDVLQGFEIFGDSGKGHIPLLFVCNVANDEIQMQTANSEHDVGPWTEEKEQKVSAICE